MASVHRAAARSEGVALAVEQTRQAGQGFVEIALGGGERRVDIVSAADHNKQDERVR